MADSPSDSTSGSLRVSISSEGTSVDDAIEVVSVVVDKGVNRIPRATIVMLDGDMPNQTFALSDSDTFRPGAAIRILAGYGDDEDPIFEGIVVKHGIAFGPRNRAHLTVECRDRAVAMTLARRSARYQDMTDGDLMKVLISGHSGLSADVEATSHAFGELVQFNCTDWDYLVTRAESNGLLVVVEGAKVTVKPTDTAPSPQLTVTWGADLIRFQAEMDARWHRPSLRATGWDSTTQELVVGESAPKDLGLQGDLSSDKLSTALLASDPKESLQSPLPLPSGVLTAWAGARQTRADLARVRGRMAFEGSAAAEVGGVIEVKGVGRRFQGLVFVSSVVHELSPGSWTTEVEFGLDPYPFAERKEVTSPPASGRVPAIAGLHIGIVRKLDENPDGAPNIQVQLMTPGLGEDAADGIWARLATFTASEGFGSFFIPEIGDEVILGFLNDDPTYPVVLGSVYSGKREPPYPLTADNFLKAIVTREKLKIEFDDERKVLTLHTPAGNTLVMDEDTKSILIEDQNQNRIELSESGILMKSPKDITLEAGGEVTITAQKDLTAKSSMNVAMEGMNIDCNANAAFTGKGGASAELSAGGNTTVKGAIVMIN
ncbi:MAG: type VI secretion system tip protein VgrG [Gemmatimonadales bacterium]|nr:MAG: type VI secretion system tip protein VgrG [Gemmatimonadales bacterium]